MLLQIVTLAWYIRHNRFAVRELDTRDLAVGGVGLLGVHGEDLGADALPLVVPLESDGDGLFDFTFDFAAGCLVQG